MAKLTGKIALVTGASKGIGAAIAKELAAHGAAVVVNYASSKKGAETVAAEIRQAGGKAVVIGGSVAQADERDALFAEIRQQFGKLDILVNNAGIYAFSPLEHITEESIDAQFGTNVKGLLMATQSGVALFPAEGGSVINISSIAAETTPPMSAVYSATKGAVNSITQVLATELGPKNIRVNAVSPGPVSTEGVRTAGFEDSEFFTTMKKQTPLGRIGQPDDIGAVVAFLASDDARWITGSVLHAAGGLRV